MAKRRRFMPALRQPSLEQKAIIIGGRGGSLQPSTVTTLGLTDRTAGWNLETVVEDGYERVVWVFKAIEVIAGNASRLPFQITSEDDEIEDHPLLRVMNKRANPMETGRQFRKRLSAQILLSKKGAFVEVTKNRRGQVTRLDLLPPDRVRIIPDPGGDYVSYYEFTRYDGVVRDLAPEKVRWIREPHPVDPFSGMTPLEPAGMSVELDRLAREYNVSFINRDGRPSGILGVDADGLDDDELTRIQERLKPGPRFAGETLAIGTGPGGMNYVDTSTRPRDMAYGETSSKSQKEILGAYGVPLSMAGDSSDRTFDNAEQEEYNFWQDPMLPHLDLIASAFDGDVDEDLDCGFDTSGVEALELPARRRRQESREEFDKGLITIKEYRAEAKHEEIDNPHTRALWISPAKAPIPSQPEDAVALGLEQPAGTPEAAGGAPDATTAAEVVAQALAEGGVAADEQLGDAAEGGAAMQAVDQARAERSATVDTTGNAMDAVTAARMEGKALDGDANEYDPGDDDAHRVEISVAAVLDAMLARQAGVIAARLESPKARRGTRYWTPDGDTDERVGDAPIDVARAVDTARWVAETQETLLPIIAPAAQSSAEDLLTAMAATGAIVVGAAAGAQVVGRTLEAPKATAEQITQAAMQAAAAPTMLALAVAQGAVEDWLNERIVDLEAFMVEQQRGFAGPGLPELIAKVHERWADHARALSSSLAVTVAQTVVQGGREAAVTALAPVVPAGGYNPDHPPAYVERYWKTRHDEDVRASHREAEGQLRLVGEPFEVGGYPVRFPSDPLAPPSVSRNCRCWIRYQWAQGATFRLPDNDVPEAA